MLVFLKVDIYYSTCVLAEIVQRLMAMCLTYIWEPSIANNAEFVQISCYWDRYGSIMLYIFSLKLCHNLYTLEYLLYLYVISISHKYDVLTLFSKCMLHLTNLRNLLSTSDIHIHMVLQT